MITRLSLILWLFLLARPARAQDDHQDLLHYIASVTKKASEDIATLRAEQARLAAAEEWNTWLLRGIVGSLIAGGGVAWKKSKAKE